MVGSGIPVLGLFLLMQGPGGEGTGRRWHRAAEGPPGVLHSPHYDLLSLTDGIGIHRFFYLWSEQKPKPWGSGRRNHVQEAHVGPGLGLRKPPPPDLWHLPVLGKCDLSSTVSLLSKDQASSEKKTSVDQEPMG
ncbi:transmembrane protein 190 isoform X4 [Heterocephalus glaber]|uniref:Transmembrane protein 190 isoform X4 n=1 Tax=Heterocephalus glaber TaxID=10181 RepID=A0AAX6RZZ4_HETGA|nr:transmembrane protein 190 isoform X4 [Heterocephalus glaber]